MQPDSPSTLPTDVCFAQLYNELRAIAQRQLRNERGGHTLQATSLVNEAWLRLSSSEGSEWSGHSEFMGAAANVMRRILVDYARARGRLKRGGESGPIMLAEWHAALPGNTIDILAVDEALVRLEQLYPRQARIVVLRFFAGLTVPEVAALLGLSKETVKRDWAMARAWLSLRLREGTAP